MADLLAIVSKAVFEKQAGKTPKVGDVLGMDRYVSGNKALQPIAAAGSRLFLVTVRPPDEAMWLVGVLRDPKFDGTQWIAPRSTVPITDISHLRESFVFESGSGIKAAPGQLGMSLQAPRKLTAADVKLLDGAIGNVPAELPAAVAAKGIEGAAMSTGGRSNALLQAILEDPHNVDAQAVYADALSQRNDPRGEFILVETALAGPLSIRKRDMLRERRRQLLADHKAEWFPYKFDFRTSRGFIVGVAASLGQLATSPVWDHEPVTEVETRIDEDDAGKLAKAKWLPRVEHLIVRGELGDEGFATLCKSKGLANLRELNVTGTGISGDALEVLTETLPKLRSLVLTANELGDDGLAHLASAQAADRLEKLYLSQCELSDVSELFGGKAFERLQKLVLSRNELSDVGAIVAGAKKLPALSYLELKRTEVGSAGVAALRKSKLGTRVNVRI